MTLDQILQIVILGLLGLVQFFSNKTLKTLEDNIRGNSEESKRIDSRVTLEINRLRAEFYENQEKKLERVDEKVDQILKDLNEARLHAANQFATKSDMKELQHSIQAAFSSIGVDSAKKRIE